MKVSIITDTDASLPNDLASQYGIRQVPISVHFGEEAFDTGVDIDDAALFVRIDRENKLPTTAAPSPGKFAKAFQAAFDEDGADEVLCFTVSSAVSTTYNAAVMAATDLMADKKITVVDTNCLSIGQGFMVLAAAKTLAAGGSVDEAVAAAKDIGGRVHLYGALATLRYLAMSGRVGQLAAGMANLLNIKPILEMESGKLELLEKVRTRKKAWERVIELTKEKVGNGKIEQLAIVHVTAPEDAKEFERMLRAQVECPAEALYAELTPGLSVHTGAGLVGVSFVTSK
ncbi:MAG: DegV family protein [Anaerolineae bacterium]|nr:DegV family protein [Anaerolineae bacterium]